MSKPLKFLLGVLAIVPFAHIIGSTVFTTMIITGAIDPKMLFDYFWITFIVNGGVVLITMGQVVFYIIHAFQKNMRITDQNTKIMWALLLLFLNMFALPIYWYMHILPVDHDPSLKLARHHVT